MRNLVGFRFAYFCSQFRGLVIHVRSNSKVLERLQAFVSIANEIIVHGEDSDLFRGQPSGEIPRKVLDKHTTKSFHGTEGSPMNHNGAMVLIVRPNIGKIEAFGEVVVDLHGSQLPLSSDHVLHHEVDFRPIKCGFTDFFLIVHIEGLDRLTKGILSFVPGFGVSYVFIRLRVSQTDADSIILHPQNGEDELDQTQASLDFLLKLVFSYKEMGIVLRKAADPSHSIQFP